MPTMIEATVSALKSVSSLLWLLLAIVVGAIAIGLPLTPATASPVATSSQSPEILFATCHFSDNSLVVIEEKLNKLFFRLSDGSSPSGDEVDKQSTTKKELENKANEDEETSLEHLNSTYRSLVNRFAKVSDEESPLPALSRMRRQIWETLNSVPNGGHHYPSGGDNSAFDSRPFVLEEEADEAENEVEVFAPSTTTPAPSSTAAAATATSTFSGVELPLKWHSMIMTCLEHYRILKRIILFERYLRSQQEKDQQQQEVKEKLVKQLKLSFKQSIRNQQDQPRQTAGWQQKMICKMSRRLQSLCACVKLYIVCLFANKVFVASLGVLTMLIFVLKCIHYRVDENMFHK